MWDPKDWGSRANRSRFAQEIGEVFGHGIDSGACTMPKLADVATQEPFSLRGKDVRSGLFQ